MPSTRLNLVVIRVSDLEASATFYSGLGLSLKKEQHGKGPEHYACDGDGVVFEIYPAHKDGSKVGPIRVGFEVPSLDDALAAVSSLGGKIVSQPKESAWARRAVASDPDGNSVELLQRSV